MDLIEARAYHLAEVRRVRGHDDANHPTLRLYGLYEQRHLLYLEANHHSRPSATPQLGGNPFVPPSERSQPRQGRRALIAQYEMGPRSGARRHRPVPHQPQTRNGGPAAQRSRGDPPIAEAGSQPQTNREPICMTDPVPEEQTI